MRAALAPLRSLPLLVAPAALGACGPEAPAKDSGPYVYYYDPSEESGVPFDTGQGGGGPGGGGGDGGGGGGGDGGGQYVEPGGDSGVVPRGTLHLGTVALSAVLLSGGGTDSCEGQAEIGVDGAEVLAIFGCAFRGPLAELGPVAGGVRGTVDGDGQITATIVSSPYDGAVVTGLYLDRDVELRVETTGSAPVSHNLEGLIAASAGGG